MHRECYGNNENWQKTWQIAVICQIHLIFLPPMLYSTILMTAVLVKEGQCYRSLSQIGEVISVFKMAKEVASRIGTGTS